MGVSEQFLCAFEKEYVDTSWCVATLPAGYPTTNNAQEGMNSGVKRVWTRHERRRLLPFLDTVRRMLHNWSHDRCEVVPGLYPNKAQLARIAAARDEHMVYCGGYWWSKSSANGVPCAITEQDAITLQQALQAGPLDEEACNLLEEYRRFNAEHCLCTEFWKYASCWHVFWAPQKVDGVWDVVRIRNARGMGYEQHPPTKKQKTTMQEADKEPAVHLVEVPKAGRPERAQKQKTKRGTKRPREEDYYPEVPGDGTPLNCHGIVGKSDGFCVVCFVKYVGREPICFFAMHVLA